MERTVDHQMELVSLRREGENMVQKHNEREKNHLKNMHEGEVTLKIH